MKLLISIVFLFVFAFAAYGQTNCSYSIEPYRTQTLGNDEGFITVNVTTQDGCEWNAEGAIRWIVPPGREPRFGSGTIVILIQSNGQIFDRQTSWVTVAGQRLTIVQEPTCHYALPLQSASFTSAGAANSFGIEVEQSCNWMPVSDSAWITVTEDRYGTGNGAINYSVAANTGAARTGTIRLGGRTFTVSQAAYAKSRKRARFF